MVSRRSLAAWAEALAETWPSVHLGTGIAAALIEADAPPTRPPTQEACVLCSPRTTRWRIRERRSARDRTASVWGPARTVGALSRTTGLAIGATQRETTRAMSLSFHDICLGLICGLRRRLECDFITELGDLAGEALDFRFGRPAVKVVDAEVLVVGSFLEHVIDGG